jgi:cytochrome d ubiquinol oxidase subunit I
MHFNPDAARNEMLNFWDVFLSPVAIHKFIHTITSGYVLASIFVIGISAWFILKKRELFLAKRSILMASVFGLISSLMLIYSGDGSTRQLVHVQPMKFAAIEGLYNGQTGAGLVAIGIMSEAPGDTNLRNVKDFSFHIEIPNFLSYMAYGHFDAFVPGVNDLVDGNMERNIMPVSDKIERGKIARETLAEFKTARDKGDTAQYALLKAKFDDDDFKNNYFRYFGYGFLNKPDDVIPNVPLSFYSFHIMVILGFYFLFLMMVLIYNVFTDKLEKRRFLLRLAVLTVPLAYLASQAGWIVAEMGRQPWVIQDLLPTMAAVSHISTTSVQVTFWMFAVLFTALLIAELSIIFRQIKIGSK